MNYRTSARQSIHDRVIQVIAYAQSKHESLTNPGQEHNWSVTIGRDTVFPDLILCTVGNRNIEHLIEVETEDSVSDAESSQWATYARGPGKFWLVVPASSLATAQTICRRKGIVANFGFWRENGVSIQFEWLNAAA